MASHSAPPPPPPPPPVLQSTKILANGRGTPKNRVDVVSIRPAQPQERLPFAGVHPEDLQYARTGLRKTNNLEPLLSREPEPLLRRSNQLANRRHWEDFEVDEALDQHSSREPVHATHIDPSQPLSVGFSVRHPNSINSSSTHQPGLPSQGSPYYSYNNSSLPINEPSSNSVPLSIPIDIKQDLSAPNSSSTFSNNSSSFFVNQQPPLNPPQSHFYQSQGPITNPQSFIRQYATQTPASSLFNGSSKTTSSYTKQSSSSTSNNNDNFLAKELRDSGLTDRQRYSNQFQQSSLKAPDQNTIRRLYQETQRYTSSLPQDPVNALVQDMEWKMKNMSTNYGGSGPSAKPNSDFCAKCGSQIVGDTPGVTALGNAYHVTCFACDLCQKQLAGCSFYNVDGKNLCQVDYMNSLEKCEKCMTPITQKILRAMGKPFHPECFACPACSKSLDGIPFTVDKENLAYCLECYHERFSPRCAVCLKAIAPSGNETEVARVIAMDRSYHIDCYRCEDCGMKLNSKIEGQGCYPLENHLFCKTCNLNRLKTAT